MQAAKDKIAAWVKARPNRGILEGAEALAATGWAHTGEHCIALFQDGVPVLGLLGDNRGQMLKMLATGIKELN